MQVKENIKARIDQMFARSNEEATIERIQLLLKTEFMFEGESYAVKYGHTLDYILSNLTLPINKDLKIQGGLLSRVPTQEERETIEKTYHRWWDMPIEERFKKVLFYYSNGWLKCRPYWFVSFGHLALDWEEILEKGFVGIRNKAEHRKLQCCDAKQKEFLEGIIISLNAFIKYFQRYAKAAEAAGLEEIAQDLMWLSENPAKTYRQALQVMWLVVLILQKVCGCGVLNYSRMDQYLLPYYQKDLAEGIMTKEEAFDLTVEFFYYTNAMFEQTDHMSEEVSGTAQTLELAFDDPNYLTLAGKNADGTGGVNELSFLMLEATAQMKLRNPFTVVRYYEGIDEEFWVKCCKAMKENATVVVYNDETMIPALKYYNVKEPEVYEYGFWGCNDPNVPGYEGGLRQLWFNLAKALELALNSGDYPMKPKPEGYQEECAWPMEDRMIGLMMGPYYGVQTKKPEEMASMDDVIEAFRIQVEYLMKEFRKGFEHDLSIEKETTYGKMRIEDCFLKGTIEEACTWTEGGTPYHKLVCQGCGLATVIDSLYAIEKAVFIDQELTLAELVEMLKHNFEGHEEWRMKLRTKYPKFGNDVAEVDKYAKIVTDIFTDAVDKNNGARYLYQMWPTYSTDRAFTTMGEQVGATPDGRKQKEPLSENQSPVEGADVDGVTAMLNSLSKVPFSKITGGPLNVRLHPTAVTGEQGDQIIAALFKSYMQQGGMQLQINVVDAATLKAAQQNPEKYRSLCVRVTGYSAYFVEMGLKAQNELIARTEHSVG